MGILTPINESARNSLCLTTWTHFVFIYKKINPLLESGGNFCPGEGGEGRLDLGQIFLLLVCQGQAGQETGQAVHHSLVLSEMK
jgi:hypothetical protein